MPSLADLAAGAGNFIKNYGSFVALLVTWVGIGWVYLRRRREWARKEFLGMVNFSLNYVIDGRLVMRTLVELPARDVWLSDSGVALIVAAARRTSEQDPFIRLTRPEDVDFLNRAALNVLSEQFAEVFLAQALGVPVKSQPYRFAVTFEKFQENRTLKLRVLVASEHDLEHTFRPGCADSVVCKSQPYVYRLRTLVQMHEAYKAAGQPGVPPLGRVELGVLA